MDNRLGEGARFDLGRILPVTYDGRLATRRLFRMPRIRQASHVEHPHVLGMRLKPGAHS
ncbi:hypothetical protein GCM10014719_46170 [Planomonospora parontospora subsp. antibiotica]|nr:hypothetical protein GCM10014719_46170 [Planomonospora parontospora subsp. antibiotica]GII16301.1 hypothetical protein Ppa05_30270 [Planomonospora parontospora subsp. antibiotica]